MNEGASDELYGNYYLRGLARAEAEPRPIYVSEATPAARRVGVEVPPSSRACHLVRVRARVRVRVNVQLLGVTLPLPLTLTLGNPHLG